MRKMTKGDAVAHLIEEDILRGRLRPGTRLLQQDLAERYNVSTTPVREALRKLESTGLLRHDPNRGHEVSATTSEELDDILAVRELVEGLEAETAAPLLTDAVLARLRELHEGMVSREGGGSAPSSTTRSAWRPAGQRSSISRRSSVTPWPC